MAKIVKGTLYRVKTESTTYFVECRGKADLFNWIAQLIENGVFVSSATEIKSNGKTPSVRVFTDTAFIQIKKERQLISAHLKDILWDDDSPTGGVSHAGETLAEFLQDVSLDYNTNCVSIRDINTALVECGIKPILFMKTMWRNDSYIIGYENACRDVVKVITFEMYDLGNCDIPYTIYNNYISPYRNRLENEGFSDVIRQIEVLLQDDEDYDYDRDHSFVLETESDYLQLSEKMISIVNSITQKKIRFCLWLAEKENVVRFYDGNEENMVEYEASSVILSDLGSQGYLFGYEGYPKQIKKKK